MRVRTLVAAGLFCAVATTLYAQTVALPPGSISSTPLVDLLAPYINVVVQAVVVGLLTWAAARFSQWTGIRIDGAQFDKVKSAAKTEAGALIANAEDNLRGRAINVGSPEIAAAATRIEAALPGIAKTVGVTPDALQKIVVGEIGKLQAATPAVVVPPPEVAGPMLGRAG